MRVVVWNLANKQRAFAAPTSLAADIELLNEAAPPADANGVSCESTLGRDSKRRPWSAAVLSPHPLSEITDARPEWRGSRREVPFACSRPGAWIAASVEVGSGPKVTAVALYGLLDEFADASRPPLALGDQPAGRRRPLLPTSADRRRPEHERTLARR